MTQFSQPLITQSSESLLALHYQVAIPQPTNHLFEITLQISGWPLGKTGKPVDLKMPVWTPGSYLVREYARHVQQVEAYAAHGDRLRCHKVAKNHWQVEQLGATDLIIRYRVYANDLSVRTNHLDQSHGYFNGAALFFYIPGYTDCPITVTILPPFPDWQVETALPPVLGTNHTYLATDFDTLVDSPFEVGIHSTYDFEAANKPHRLVVWGHGNLAPEHLVADMQKVIEVEANLFGGLPYDRYLFLLHLAPQGFGGLEHKFCCSLIYQRFGFRAKEKYDRFIQLVAHEFFHLWNVKRIRPKALERFDYEQENYTPSLWFSEGVTSFYDLVIPYRAGIYDAKAYLSALSQEMTRYLNTPGRLVQPLSESSFDAWIKLYRPDANSPNSQISYYLKGEMVALLLDLLIRQTHGNQRSLDDVLRQLWQQFGQDEIGFTPTQLEQVIEGVAEQDLTDFFTRYLHSTEELPFNLYLQPFGLQLEPEKMEEEPPFLGLMVKTEANKEMVKQVVIGSPAEQAGIAPGAELLAIDGIRVSGGLNDRLRDYQPGNTLQIAFFYHDELCIRPVVLATPRPTKYTLIPVKNPTSQQAEAFRGWLGVALTTVG